VTGAPGEGTCIDCHGGADLNTGGSITLLGAPVFYRPGGKYTITLRLASAQTSTLSGRVWGFQVTAVQPNGNGTGVFTPLAGQGTQLVSGEGGLSTRQYVEQTAQGLRDGIASPVDWQFEWTAPDPGDGAVTFHAAALAADGDGSESGDWTYVAAFASQDTTTPAVLATWGRVKSVYR
jgi:hypothetical protein